MNNTIASLALLKTNWDSNIPRKDYLENFVPFMVTLIYKRDYKTVKVNTICKDFETEYGLRIPYHPMLTILSRTLAGGYLEKKRHGDFVPVRAKIVDGEFSAVVLEQERKYKRVLEQFIQFSLATYKETLSEIEAESAFISFLKDHDLDILFINQDINTLLDFRQFWRSEPTQLTIGRLPGPALHSAVMPSQRQNVRHRTSRFSRPLTDPLSADYRVT
jgi:hypothetical protein